jgi:hypothetical protein
MDTGLMSLPVAQAGFGGFIKSITRAPRAIAKGVSKAVRGVAKGVRNVAKSPIGRIALPLALGYFAPTLIPKLAALSKPALYGGAAGLSSLIAGDDPEEAFRRGATAAALTYAGGKLFGQGTGAAGKTAKDISVAQAGDVAKVAADPALLSYGDVGVQQVAELGLQGAPIGSEFAGGLTGVNVAGTGVDPSVFSSYQQAAPAIPTSSYTGGAMIGQPDIAQAVYPGSGVGGGSTPVIQDKVLTDRTLGQRISDSLSGRVDEAGTLLTREIPGLDKVASLIPESKLGKAALGVGALSLLGGQQPVQQFTPQQLSSANLRSGFDEQGAFYEDIETGEKIPYTLALSRIQAASQDFGAGGQRKASGVRLAFENIAQPQAKTPLGSVEELGQFATSNLKPVFMNQSGGVVDPMLSSSGGIMSMMYGGQTMPQNNMDVKYKEFSGMVGGRGDGMEDNVYMPIVEGETGQQVATLAVSPKEYVVDANTMSLLGNGNPDEGAEIMDQTVKDIRKKATGQTKQQKEIDGLAALNRMRRSVS